jgi:hypothetical protein
MRPESESAEKVTSTYELELDGCCSSDPDCELPLDC